MRVLLTGAHGFIGRAFVREALRRGHEIMSLSRSIGSFSNQGIQVVECPQLSTPPWQLIEAFAPDAFLHLAWIVTPGIYLNSPENAKLLHQSIRLYQGLLNRGVPYLSGTGTCIEYAASRAPLHETRTPLAPSFPYSSAKSKLAAWLAERNNGAFGATTGWFRIFHTYGPGEHPDRLSTLTFRQLAEGRPAFLNTPESIKDYIHVDDLATALCIALEARSPGPLNLGTGEGVRLADFARVIAEEMGLDPSLIQAADPLSPDPWPVRVADSQRLRDLGWEPQVDLRKGLRGMVAHLRETIP